MGLFFTILSFASRIIPVIPQLVTAAEGIFKGRPKSGPSKWLFVEQALAGEIQQIVATAQSLTPSGTKGAEIESVIAKYTKAVNDATVEFFNAVGLFPKS